MPLWDFKCKDCGNTEEQLVKRWSLPVLCSKCDGETERQVGKSSFILKGDCWAKDNYSSKKEKNQNVKTGEN